jgi:hypothetical protein
MHQQWRSLLDGRRALRTTSDVSHSASIRSVFFVVSKLTAYSLLCTVTIISSAIYLYTPTFTPKATAAPNNTINFQARLLSNTGAVAPDGYYNAQFKLYDAASGGTLLWTDTRYDTNGPTAGNDYRVQVKNGYLTVSLGDTTAGGTAFPGSIDWSQELWLSMNIGGTTQTASPTWNGEMNPRMKVTAVPFAQAANKLKGSTGLFDADQLAQLGQSTVQTVNSANTAIRINQTGAGSLLQFQASGNDRLLLAANGNLTVAGTGVFQGASVSIGTSSQAGVLTLNDGSSNTTTIQAAATSANLTFTLPNAYGSTGECLVGNGAGGLSFSNTCGTGGSGSAPETATYLTLSNDPDLTNERVLTAGTNIGITDAGANGTLTVNVANSPTFSGTLTVQGASLTIGTTTQQGSLILNDGSSNTTTLQSAAVSSNLTFKLPSGYGTSGDCIVGDGAGGFSFSSTCGAGGSGTAPVGASYLTLGLDGTLTSERVLTAGSNISITDGGANGNLTVATTDNPSFATSVTSPLFTGTGAVTIASTGGANALTLTSGSGTIVLGASTLQRSAAGTTTIDLNNAANTTLAITNSNGTGVASLTVEGGATLGANLSITAGGVSVTGNSTIAGTLSSLTGLTSSGTITFSGLNTAGMVTTNASGVLSTGAVDRNSATYFNTALSVANGGTGATTSQGAINAISQLTTNGDLLYNNGTNSTRLARGTNGQCLVSNATTILWQACSGAGSGSTLQAAYDAGNTITTTDARDLSVTLANTTTDSNFLVNIATSSTSKFAVQNNGTDVLTVTSTGVTFGTTINIGTNNIVTSVTTIASTELDRLDGKDAALVDTNDAVNTSITGTGALNVGSITSGFGTINNADTITGTTLNGTTGINTGAGAGTNRIDVNGNLVNIGNLTGTGAVTIASTGGANALTLTSGSGTIVLGASTLQRSAAGTTTIDLNNAANTTLAITNSNGTGVASLTVEGGATLGANLSITAGGVSVTGNSTIAGTLSSLTGLTSSGTITFSGLNTAGMVTTNASGVLSTGAVDRNSATYFNTALSVANGGTGATTSQGAINAISQLTTEGDLLFRNATNTTRLARGGNNQCLISTSTTIQWGSCATGGSGFTSLTLTGNSGTNQTINEGDSINIRGDGTVLTAVAGATDTITLSVVADSIGDSQLQYNTGQNLTTTSNVQFANITGTGDLTAQGNTTLGNNASIDRLTVTSQILGTNALSFQGATDNTFTTTFAISDPTVNQTITFPNATGTVCLTSGNCAGVGGTGDILQGGNSFGAAVTIGANDSFGINLETAGTTRFSIDNTGAGLMNGSLAVAGNFTVNTDKLVVNTTSGNTAIGSTDTTTYKLNVVGGSNRFNNGNQTLTFLTGTNTSGYAADLSVNDDGVNLSNNSASRGYNFKNSAGTLLSLSAAGNATVLGNLNTTGQTLTVGSAGCAYFNFNNATNSINYCSNAIEFNTSQSLGYVFTDSEVRVGSGGTVDTASADGDLYVQDFLEVDGSSSIAGSLTLGTDTQLSRGAADRLDLASGDSFNLVSGSIQQNGINRLTSAGLFQSADGAVGGPSYSFSSDTNTGMYSVAADTLGFATNGAKRLQVSNTAIASSVPLIYDQNANVITYKNVYSYTDGGNPDTGTFALVMPKSWSNTMMRMRIVGYDFTNNTAGWEATIAGYNYSPSPGWGQVSAEITGNAPFTTIRLAHNGTNNVILLGNTTTTWYYPKIIIEEFVAGHTNVTGWETGWSGSFIVNEASMSYIVTPTVQKVGNSSNSFFQNGNSFGATAVLGTNDNNNLDFETNGTTRWSITTAGILQSSGAQTIQTSTGALTIATGGGNGNIVLNANGTGILDVQDNVTFAGTLTIGSDVVLSRGAANRLDLASGDSLNLIQGQIMTDSGNLSILTTGSAATGVRANGLLLGSSYDSTPLQNEIRSTANQNLYLNSRGTGNLYFQTADSTKMTVLNNGNVGIGNPTPSYPLDINSANGLSIGLANGIERIKTISSSVSSPWDNLDITSRGNSAGWRGSVNLNVSYSNGSIFTGLTVRANTDGTSANVGIGTTSPGNRLSVVTSGQDTLPALGANGGKLSLLNDGGAYGMIAGVLSSGNIYMQAQRVDATATAYGMLLQPNGGNVSIGTTDASTYKLSVNGKTQIKATDQTSTGLLVLQASGGTNYWDLAFDHATTPNLWLQYNGSGTPTMYWQNTGNVGLGTSSPLGDLHVGDNTGAGVILDNRQASITSKIGAQIVWAESGTYSAGDLLIAPRTSGVAGALRVFTGTTPTERMTIDGAGATSLSGNLSVTGSTTIAQTADDATYTGFVTNDGGVLKYRTAAQVATDIGAVTKTTSTRATDTVNGTWYRIATSSGGGNGRGAAKIVLTNGGGSGTPNQIVFNVVKDWGTSGLITMLSQNGTSCWNTIRMVNDSGTPTTTYIDAQASSACQSSEVTVTSEGSSMNYFVASSFTAPAGGAEVTISTLDITNNTLFGISSGANNNTFRIQPSALLSAQTNYSMLTTTTGTISVGSATSTLVVGNALTVAGNTTLGDAAGDALTVNANTMAIPNNLNIDSNTLFINASTNRVGLGTNNPSYKLVVDGAHGDTQFLMHSAGDGGATNTADLMLWASEPDSTYTGVGIANNMYNTTGFPRINTNRGGSMMRLLDNSIEFTTVNSSGTQLTGMALNGSGNVTIAGTLRVNGSGILNSSGYEVVQTNATDWLRINQNNSFTNGTAAYGNWAFGTGGISVGSWGTAGAGNIQATGSITTGVASSANGSVIFRQSASANTMTLQAPTGALASSLTLTLPNTIGAASECLKNSGTAGTLTFGNCSTASLQDVYNNSSTPATIATSSTSKDIVFKPATGNDNTDFFQLQNAAGTAFVTADSSNQTLILRDKTGSASIGSNLVTSQAFNNATYWTCTGWTTTATNATHNVGNTTGCATTGSNLSFSSYEYYEVKFTISGNSNPSNTITPSLGNWNYISYGANQTYTLVMHPTSTGSLTFTPTSNFNGTISNVSVKLISGSTSVLSVSDSGAIWNPIEVRVDGGVGFGYQTLVNNTTGGGNSAFGSSALNFNTSGNNNSAFGGNALAYNTIGTFNSAFGRYSLWYNSSGSYNVAIGGYSLSNNTIGNNNTAVGYQSLYSNTTGYDNTALGVKSLYSNISGSGNTASGYQSLYYNTTGYNNTAAGYESLRSNTTGIHNTASGFWSLYYNQTGSMNTAFGLNAGRGNGLTFSNFNNNSLYGYAAGMSLQTGGDNNILIGYQAGDAITTGASNILLGYDIDAQSATGSNQLSIGNVIFGGGGFGTGTTVGTGRIGIGGVEDGTDKLRVYGDVKVGTSGTNGCIKRFDGAALTGTCSSDERFKEDITSMNGILDKVANLQAVTYKFNQLGKDYTGATGNEIQYGLIAQQVLQVAPELVSTDENGYLKLRYDLLPIYAIAAIGEQQTQITDAQSRLSSLENSIQPASNNILDLTNGGTIQGNLNVVGNLNVTGPVTMSSLTVTDDVVIAGNLTVQNVTVANITINGHIITAGNTPTATVGTAAGVEDTNNNIPAPQVTIEGNDTAGTITIVAGANTVAGDLVEMNFSSPFSKAPKIMFSGLNKEASRISTYFEDTNITSTGIKVSTEQQLEPGKTYKFNYWITE